MLWVLIWSASVRHFEWVPTTCFHGKIRKVSILLDWKKHLIKSYACGDNTLRTCKIACSRLRKGDMFLMTDSICHSSLPRTVLERVTLTTIKFRIYLRTKVDPMFTVCILVRHWRAIHTKVVWLVLDLWWVAEKTRLNTCANNKGADQPAHLRRLISAFVVRYSSFFDEEASHKLKWRTEWYLEFISFS